MSNSSITVEKKYNGIIVGSGSALPRKILTNYELSEMVDTTDEWIVTRTGIKERHICSESETTATLAAKASLKALEDADMDATELDLIIIGTITPEMVFPSTACFVQDSIGATNAFAFDITAACSGFIYGLSIAENFIASGRYKNILVIGAEALSKITDYNDRGSCILFGDGAGAIILQASQDTKSGLLYTNCAADGSGWTSLNCQAYGSRNPVSKKLEDPSLKYMKINGREVYQLAVRRIVEMVRDCLENCNLNVEDIKVCIPHQMNARIIESSAKRLKLRDDQIFINIHKTGNTSAASIPIAFDEYLRTGEAKKGDIIVLVAFGAGLTWGASIFRL